MPIYTYQCEECGLQFEGHTSMAKREDPRACPECGTSAKRTVPEEVSGHFNHEVSGPVPQNTGIAGLDADYDRVIAQHAQQGWSVIDQRVREKRRIMASEGVPGEQLSRNLDGSYRTMSPDEHSTLERGLAIHHAAMDWRQEEKKARRSRSGQPTR